MGRGLAICTALAALALAAAGCGGGSQTATEKWADDLCTSINTWADTIEQTKSTLSDPSSLSVSSATDALTNVKDATQTLAGDVRDLGAPPTDASGEAKQQLSALSDTIDTQNQVIQDAANSGANTLAGLLGKVTAITGALAAMGSAAQTAYNNVSSLNGAGELQDAFKSQKSCDQARSTLGDLRSSVGSG